MKMKKWIPAVWIVGGLAIAASALVHPFGHVKAVFSAEPLLAGSSADPALQRIIERSCQSCHSERTEWPWYSYIAPVGWMIENDVSEGRQHLNLSRWEEYSSYQRSGLLSKMAAAIRNRQMPPGRYTLLHPAAKLSNAEIAQIDQWTQAERQRLKSAVRESGNKTGASRVQAIRDTPCDPLYLLLHTDRLLEAVHSASPDR
jgi:hypothetical protein